MRRTRLRVAGFVFVAMLPVAVAASADAPRSPTPAPVPFPGRVVVVARDLEHPWGLAFLPDRTMLVSERPGRLRRIAADGTPSPPLAGVPRVMTGGQAGLLDVTLSPAFASDHLVYLCFSEPGDGGVASTAVARGRLDDGGLRDTAVVWRQQPKVSGSNHWGCRLVFRPDGTLFVTLGERFDHRELAQDLHTTLGKIVRIRPDGTVPPDNPFVGRSDADPAIWSYGHRNIQAAALQPDSHRLYTVEHGARGGDELNRPEPGRNYGWPIITYGVDYDGSKIGIGTAAPGMEQPLYWWDPVIAPSGATFYTGDAFPDWRGNLLVGSLNPGGLVRLVLDDVRVVREERYRDGELDARIRDVVQGPDGLVYLLTDEDDGKVLRLEPRREGTAAPAMRRATSSRPARRAGASSRSRATSSGNGGGNGSVVAANTTRFSLPPASTTTMRPSKAVPSRSTATSQATSSTCRLTTSTPSAERRSRQAS